MTAVAPARAQTQNEQLWLQVNTHVPLARDLSVALEQIARFRDRVDGLFQTEFGGILGYRLSKKVELGSVATRFRIDQRVTEGSDQIRLHPSARALQP